jgi:tetratricopeptide (TPR) repeat protein
MVGPMSNYVSGPQLVENTPYGKDMKAMQSFARNFYEENRGKSSETIRLVGFCLLVKKEVIDMIGGFDEGYKIGNSEDNDLCLRACIAGFRNIIAHDVFIHHYGSMTFKGNSIDYQATMERNRTYFAEKWKDIVEVNGNAYRVCMTKEYQVKKLIEWGEERYAQRDVHAAIKLFERVLKLDRNNPQALNNLGVLQWQLGAEPSAMRIFQTALKFDPKDVDALENLVQAATETGRFDLIDSDLLDTLKDAQPTNPDLAILINKKRG